MMMDCPRCGFTQPKDQYCAQCGLDVEHYVAKPTPVTARVLQNPNFYLSLIGMLLAVVALYILVTQGARIGRNIIAGRPLSSREAGDPTAVAARGGTTAQADLPEPEPAPEAVPVAAKAAVPVSVADKSAVAPAAQEIEISSFEIPKDALPSMLGEAQRLAEGSEGRAYIWTSANNVAEMIAAGARPLGHSHKLEVGNSSQLAIETPPGGEGFQFALYFQVAHTDKEVGLRWDSNLVVAPESPGNAPAVRQLAEANLSGQAPLTPESTVLLVFDPATRTPREEYVRRAGPGPWSVFSSPDFRNGSTDWVVLIQMKTAHAQSGDGMNKAQ